MCKLHKLGLYGIMWSPINDWHSNTYFSMYLTRREPSGFKNHKASNRQGGVLSTFLYLVFIDNFLLEIQNKSSNIRVLTVQAQTQTKQITYVSLLSLNVSNKKFWKKSFNTRYAGDLLLLLQNKRLLFYFHKKDQILLTLQAEVLVNFFLWSFFQDSKFYL